MSLSDIHKVFVEQGYTWTYTDGKRTPTEEEIVQVVDKAHKALAAEGDNTQVEVGRLIIRRAGSFIDVYVHIAERRLDGLG